MNATTTWFCAPFVLPTCLQSLMSIIVEVAASATTIAVIQFPNLHKKYPTADSRFKKTATNTYHFSMLKSLFFRRFTSQNYYFDC
uniref:Uncharacterized protein n=1 Tax=Glossina palpalis gambiensis TaxID=67801 RepID=A0A1B0BDY6_9MUSC